MDILETIGYIAATLTTISFVPQAAKIIKTKDTKSISLVMYALFTLGVICWLVYGIATNDIPVAVANGITLFFALIILSYKIKYK